MSVVETFSRGVEDRMRKDGWVEVIVPILMPFFMSMIEQCLNNRQALADYAKGTRNRRQAIQLRLAARSTVSEAGVRGPIRIGRATSALVDAIHAELDVASGMDGSGTDIYQDAIDEAFSYE